MAFLSQNVVQSIKYVISAALQLGAKRWEISEGIDYTVVWQVCPRWGDGCLEGTQDLLWLKTTSEPVRQQTLKANNTCTGVSVLFIIPPNAPLMNLIGWLEGKLEKREEVKTKTKKKKTFISLVPKENLGLIWKRKTTNETGRTERFALTLLDITAHHKVKVYKDDSKCILISITQHHQNLDFAQNAVKEIQRCSCSGRCRRKLKFSSIYTYKSGIFNMSLPFGYGVLKAGRCPLCSYAQQSVRCPSCCL